MREAEIVSDDVCMLIYIYKYKYAYISVISFRNGQLHIGDQIVCVNDIYLDSHDSTLAVRAHQLLIDSTRLSIELVVIATTTERPHAAVSTSNNDGHSCVPTLSTPFHVDMVVR
jgi:hypothetical protein